jgi:formamidopyrimidine-DNA glycosylase
MSAELFRSQLGGSRRAVKVALLDQRAVAGIGNLYASEILHLAGVHPAGRCDRLSRDAWRRIAEATQEVLETAIRFEGSTLGDGTYRNALNQSGGYQNHHRVYDREGKACPRCGSGSEVVRIVQAQRSTFFCGACQRRM